MELLENALSLRTSAHAGVVPQGYFLRAQSPGFSNILAVKPSCFHSTGGLRTSDVGHWFAATYFSNSSIFTYFSQKLHAILIVSLRFLWYTMEKLNERGMPNG